MITYKLKRYNMTSIEEELVSISEDQQLLVNQALEQSFEQNQITNYWTYRVDTYDGDVCIGRFRWFNNGREITNDIIFAVMGNRK